VTTALSLPVLRDACRARVLQFLLPTLAHALRAPLNGMNINLELLQELLRPGLPESAELAGRRERTLAALGRSVAQVRTSVDALLAEAGLGAAEPGALDLRELLQEVVAALRPQAVVQRVTLAAALPESAAPIEGSRADLRQAVLAIAVNALEAMPAGGELEIALQREGGHWLVAVSDGGPGITPELRQRVGVEPCSSKPERGGTGLLFARAVAAAHGGAFTIESTTGSGTRACLAVAARGGR